jgi:hypothetical protein
MAVTERTKNEMPNYHFEERNLEDEAPDRDKEPPIQIDVGK